MASIAGRDPSSGTAALPVAVLAQGRNADAVRTWIEGVLGWQPVETGADPLVPAAVELLDLESDGEPSGRVPSVLLVDDDAPAEHSGVIAARVSPSVVLGWPSGRDRLEAVVTEALARDRRGSDVARLLRVGGSAGGVGTTTVVLALAGLSAWSGLRTFVALRGTGLRLRELPAAALATPDLWSRADPLPGLTSLRGVVVGDGGAVPDLTDGHIEAGVFDVGVDADADVLVCRPDAAALAALEVTTAAAVVVVGEGPARARDLARAAGGRRALRVPWSARVARAGLQGRVPAGLPGAWMVRLEPLALRRSAPRGRDAANVPGPGRPAVAPAVHSPSKTHRRPRGRRT